MRSIVKLSGAACAAAMLMAGAARGQDAAGTGTPAKAAPRIEDLLPDKVIIKGKGWEIKQSQLDEAIRNVKMNNAAQGQEIPPDKLPLVQRQLMDRLIQIRILNSLATDADKAKGKEDADKRFDVLKQRMPNEEMLAKQLKTMGMTVDTLKSRLADETTAEVVLRSRVSVSTNQIKQYYDENPSQFEEAEKVRASHILISTMDIKTGVEISPEEKVAKRKIIEGLLKQARDGEDFAKLAKEFSDDPGSKDKGGEYTFPRGQMAAEFEAAAFSLKTNQVSDVVTTRYGYHIIKLSEKIPAHRVELAKVSPDIKDYLERKEIEKQMPTLYPQLKKDAGVEILDDDLKKLEDMPLPPPQASAGGTGPDPGAK